MVSFGEKAKIKQAGNLNYGRSYVITTLLQMKEKNIAEVLLHWFWVHRQT